MKKILYIIGLIALVFWWVNKPVEKIDKPAVEPKKKLIQEDNTPTEVKLSKSIFVPYWSLTTDSLPEEFSRVIYFGIAANKDGINRDEPGYTNLARFDNISTSNQKKYLTLRLLDTETNLELLSNTDFQQKIINETITIAQQHEYDGVVLDLELSVLPVASVTAKINTFVQDFYLQAQDNNMGLLVTMYGDAFYRHRPFDIKFIAEHSDEVLIMAYDFSKSYGEPGPNFPAQGRGEYGYDFETMINDFSQVVPAHKLGIIFGMYGYDWTLGAQGKPLRRAEAVTQLQLNEKYLNACTYADCVVKRDELSGERVVEYRDEEKNMHAIWSEDEESMQKKIKLMNGKFSGNIIYWAYGYF